MDNLQNSQENVISIFIPMQIKKRGSSAMVILPKNAAREDNKPNYDYTLINAFARAYKWQKSISNGSMTIEQIMDKENIRSSFASRILRLNLIAPDIVKAIVEGKQPRDLKLQDFMITTIPDLWHEQIEKFGFI